MQVTRMMGFSMTMPVVAMLDFQLYALWTVVWGMLLSVSGSVTDL